MWVRLGSSSSLGGMLRRLTRFWRFCLCTAALHEEWNVSTEGKTARQPSASKHRSCCSHNLLSGPSCRPPGRRFHWHFPYTDIDWATPPANTMGTTRRPHSEVVQVQKNKNNKEKGFRTFSWYIFGNHKPPPGQTTPLDRFELWVLGLGVVWGWTPQFSLSWPWVGREHTRPIQPVCWRVDTAFGLGLPGSS